LFPVVPNAVVKSRAFPLFGLVCVERNTLAFEVRGT